ncbi:MAG: cation transport regulator ChaB [Humibacillus sp.]|nr:cation transport regulator ChaB [Humibacillus sp.]
MPGTRRTKSSTSSTTGRSATSSDDLPSTLARSPRKAQETWLATHAAAVEQYGEGERAHRTAFASLKHTFEKVGDHWEEKEHAGPSDEQATRRGAAARAHRDDGDSAGGVDAFATKEHLYGIAQRLEVPGRSSMTKAQLVEAIQKANDRATAAARDT